MRRTKTVCTIGPACYSKKMLESLIRAGMDVARLNFSYGDYKTYVKVIQDIRSVSKKLGRPIAIMQDLQGPRIRIGDIEEGLKVARGQKVIVTSGRIAKRTRGQVVIPQTYKNLYQDIKKSDVILINNGLIKLKVLNIRKRDILCRVKIPGQILSRNSINIPSRPLNISPVTSKDKEDIKFGVDHDVDFIALSFVQRAKDVVTLNRIIRRRELQIKNKLKDKTFFSERSRAINYTKIISKIETKIATKNFDEILKASDGVMVARGDLGIETELSRVPLVQKEIIAKSLKSGKPVITATQMLSSMVSGPSPTRAEISDIANAVIDHTDAIMLSQETASGKYPVDAVKVMNRVAWETEESPYDDLISKEEAYKYLPISLAVSSNAVKLAKEVKAKLIICLTSTGYTARTIVRYRPEIKVLALTPYKKIYNQLSLSWGIIPFFFSFGHDVDTVMRKAVNFVKRKKIVKPGDKVVIISGYPFRVLRLGDTNLIKVEKV